MKERERATIARREGSLHESEITSECARETTKAGESEFRRTDGDEHGVKQQLGPSEVSIEARGNVYTQRNAGNMCRPL